MTVRTTAIWLMILLVCLAHLGRASSITFSDNFSGPTLNPAWQVLPGQGTTIVGGGKLRYIEQGPLSSPAGWGTTSLSLALPFNGTNWEIDARATYSLGWCVSGNYSGPPVPNQGCSSGAQRPQLIVAFDPVTAGDRSALGGTNYADFDRGIDAWYGSDDLVAHYGNASAAGLLSPADSIIVNNIAGGTYFYQFIRDGAMLTMNVSTDGRHFVTALSAQLAAPSSSFNELILTGTTYSSVGSFADFGPVTITDTSAPEPGGAVLFGLGLAAIGIGRFRRRAAGRQERA